MNKIVTEKLCPICASYTVEFYADKRRSYLLCEECGAIHVPSQHHLSANDEKAEYDKHENDVSDEGYRKFLTRMMEPLLERVEPASQGLDFGCGPGPALARMLEERGFSMSVFDKYYANTPAALERHYDFICATEVVEHLAAPLQVFEKLWSLLKPGGVLGIMTKRVNDLENFYRWHYKNDPTHIVFFHEKTFRWIAKLLQAELKVVSADVILLIKPTAKTQP
ncbi:MAG: class I SAM-dependent methyltransferase [Cellvibrionaceae bacterium]